MTTIRTRIAPSPTGQDIHIGNLYTALMNWAFAKKHTGQFIIRIEDTDRQRFQEGAEARILSSVKAFGLSYDEGPDIGGPYAPYRQSDRLDLYKRYAEELIEKGKAYYCFCTPERLDELRKKQQAEKQVPRYDKYCLHNVSDAKGRIEKGEKYVVRLNVVPGKKIWFEDIIRGRIDFESDQVDDQVLLKSDGYPTYHLGVVVDDNLMKVTHVIRAEEWIPSTPKHVILYESFGWKLPVFAHLPILRNPDRSKLSKRKNPVWASWYLEEGYLPEAVLNFLTLMGWSHPDQKDIFSMDEFVSLFKIEDINPAGPVFDLVKLTWMNQQYIQRLSDDELLTRLKAFFHLNADSEPLLQQLIPLLKERMQVLKDFTVLTGHFFGEPEIVLGNDQEKKVAQLLLDLLAQVTDWQKDSIFTEFKKVMMTEKIRMPLLYKLFTGAERGLPLPESLAILGKERTLARLKRILS
jgi:glutamyl-tRNA synthetase